MSQQSEISMLQHTANQLLATVAPAVAPLLTIGVRLESDSTTASTDGETLIIMPEKFCGEPIPQNQTVSVGLLAHEVGHFLQPLADVQEVEEAERIPPWLVNLVLDIQGESLITSIFPALQHPLGATRRVVHQACLAEYRQQIAQAASLQEVVGPLALFCRFAQPDHIFASAACTIARELPRAERCRRLMELLESAQLLSATMLPDFLRRLIQRFPELRQAEAPTGMMAAPRISQGSSQSDVLLKEAQKTVGQWRGGQQSVIRSKQYRTAPAKPEAVRMARSLRGRFVARQGKSEIMAPGRFDRHEAARGNFPFRMALSGKAQPAPNIVLCVDVSDSMRNGKQEAAFIAAQALALAIAENDGHVVGLLFDGAAAVAIAEDASPLFAVPNQWQNKGGTCFLFLAALWRRWPEHQVILVTDGYGEIPNVLAKDKQRTAAIVIPDADVDGMRQVCQRVIKLDDMAQLPSLMAMLVPRTQVG